MWNGLLRRAEETFLVLAVGGRGIGCRRNFANQALVDLAGIAFDVGEDVVATLVQLRFAFGSDHGAIAHLDVVAIGATGHEGGGEQ